MTDDTNDDAVSVLLCGAQILVMAWWIAGRTA
jgi:hypothetical protein